MPKVFVQGDNDEEEEEEDDEEDLEDAVNVGFNQSSADRRIIDEIYNEKDSIEIPQAEIVSAVQGAVKRIQRIPRAVKIMSPRKTSFIKRKKSGSRFSITRYRFKERVNSFARAFGITSIENDAMDMLQSVTEQYIKHSIYNSQNVTRNCSRKRVQSKDVKVYHEMIDDEDRRRGNCEKKMRLKSDTSAPFASMNRSSRATTTKQRNVDSQINLTSLRRLSDFSNPKVKNTSYDFFTRPPFYTAQMEKSTSTIKLDKDVLETYQEIIDKFLKKILERAAKEMEDRNNSKLTLGVLSKVMMRLFNCQV